MANLPPPPAPEPEKLSFSIPSQLNETIEEVYEVTEVEDNDYRQLWKRTSDKPLQQVYGHIDRIGSGEVGSLLDRYADRFGSELDREIIVLRQQERQQKMQELHQVPIVELIEENEVNEDIDSNLELTEEIETEPLDEETMNDLEDELDTIETQIIKIEKVYNKAKKKKKDKDIKKYGEELSTLLERRDSINALLDGEEEFEVSSETKIAKTVEEDIFQQFVGIVDELLGKLPEEKLNLFLESKEFEIYKSIASNPGSADQEEKSEFFKLVNDKLAQLPEDAINEFIASDNWPLYEEVGELYN